MISKAGPKMYPCLPTLTCNITTIINEHVINMSKETNENVRDITVCYLRINIVK